MTFGLEIRDASGTITTSSDKPGGAIFLQKINQSSGSSQTYTFTDVPGGAYLRVNQVGAGGHYYIVGTNASNQATLEVIARIGAPERQYSTSSTFLIFAARTTETSSQHGIALFNTNAERIISNVYNIPQFAYKVPQANWTFIGSSSIFAPSGYQAYTYGITFPSDGSGDKFVYYNLPVNSNDTWYAPDGSHFNVTGAFSSYMTIISNVAPVLPQAFLFRCNNLSTSNSNFGLRMYNGSGNILFDSHIPSLVIEKYTDNVSYPLGNTMGIINTFPGVFIDNTSLILVPHHYQERITRIGVSLASYDSEYTGAVRRNGTSLQTQTFYISRNWEDMVVSGNNLILTYGSSNGLFIPCLNGLLYGAT